MMRRRFVGLGLLAVLATACGPDPNDALGAVASSVAQAAASASSGNCTPVSGYTAPITDKGLVTADGPGMNVSAGDFFFQPTCIAAPDGGTFTLKVTNTGAILHNVTIADQNIDVDVAVGETVEIPISLTGPDPLVYVCKFHRTAGMVGAVLPPAP